MMKFFLAKGRWETLMILLWWCLERNYHGNMNDNGRWTAFCLYLEDLYICYVFICKGGMYHIIQGWHHS